MNSTFSHYTTLNLLWSCWQNLKIQRFSSQANNYLSHHRRGSQWTIGSKKLNSHKWLAQISFNLSKESLLVHRDTNYLPCVSLPACTKLQRVCVKHLHSRAAILYHYSNLMLYSSQTEPHGKLLSVIFNNYIVYT